MEPPFDMHPETLRAVELAAERHAETRAALHDAIRAAYRNGWSHRRIASEALISHEQVRRIVGATRPDWSTRPA